MKTKNQEQELDRNQTEDQDLSRGILNVNGLMDLLCVTRQTAINYIREGKVPAYKVGPGKYLISVGKLIKVIEENKTNFIDSQE